VVEGSEVHWKVRVRPFFLSGNDTDHMTSAATNCTYFPTNWDRRRKSGPFIESPSAATVELAMKSSISTVAAEISELDTIDHDEVLVLDEPPQTEYIIDAVSTHDTVWRNMEIGNICRVMSCRDEGNLTKKSWNDR
jgi:hypothetical protein